MQSRPSAAAALSYVTESTAATHRLSGAHHKAGHVSVERGDSVAMVDDHGASVTIHQIGKADHTVSRRDNARAVLGSNVHTAMESSFTVERINALSERSGETSDDRPQRWRGRHTDPITRSGFVHVQADSDGCCAA